jgi:CheY-like chemotaxis protein
MISLRSWRILVIEDEMLIALMLQGMLEALGHHVAGRARTVVEALAVIQADADRIDAATLDINLAGEHSTEVADALKARGIPFIITTGYDDQRILGGFHDQPIVRKPYVSAQLEQALRSLELRS